ncbi:interleukin-2 receptor subunit alpha isoform X2 [Vombatus ursinus]|uniref:Interleukin-2 receptor subunit alpha n=1 Tax=Vombatus ursinus TaxID=29139 RepID=A0A4X2KI87_VOMUR|nr:interleukin-2 receptor subunit alpha isoform X2 [Vombatus ursinus]
MAWNFLLIWGIFTSIMVADYAREECPHPPQIDFASFETQIYMKGTILDCSCKPGYDRKEGTPLLIVCEDTQGHLSWNDKCQCKGKSPQSQEEQSVSSAPINPGEQTDRTQTITDVRLQTYNLTGHCLEPVLWSHASETKSYQFVVGQTLQYQCLKTSKYKGTAESTCIKSNGKLTWTKPHLKCSNVTSTETSVPSSFTIEHKIAASTETSAPSSCTTEYKIAASTETPVSSSFATEHKIAVAACIFLMSFVIFLVWITWRKRWRRRRQTAKEKTKKREVRSQQYCGKNHMPDHPVGLLSA